ncbi:MAG: glycosyltransferase [Muribaculaceae bacterium]|nr:glycosyltransferase [Muribaculaceae bacterium]
MKFSLIVPVYNRPDEVADLLQSLDCQSNRDFELILVEDGSTIPCLQHVEQYASRFPIRYFAKSNEGRSIARNYGMEHAGGDYFVFVDSDCILPSDYFEKLSIALRDNYTDCFGGPDAAHDSFTDTQKAINFAMTAFLTTGGIRGGKVSMEKFVPRTFNMGFSRRVWEAVGGFREMFSEDIDMSTRIRNAGFSPQLYRDVKVFHKRRGNLAKFWRQVHVFGMSRITLQLLYPGSMKLVHWMPAVFTIGSIMLLLLGIILSPLWLIPLALYLLALWISAIISTRSLKIGTMAVAASMVQLYGYGTGFLRAYIWKILLRHGRDEAQEVAMRKGK